LRGVISDWSVSHFVSEEYLASVGQSDETVFFVKL
jgi:hypothetical protein